MPFPARFRAAILAAALASIPFTSALAAEQTRAYLYTKFENGDIPTGQDFKDLIDSALNFHDDGLTSFRVGLSFSPGTTNAAVRLSAGDLVGPASSAYGYADVALHPALQPLWLGASGFLPMEFIDAASQIHYGYFQLSMAAGPLPPGPGGPGPAIFVEYLVWETQPDTPMTAHTVPAPTAATIALSGLLLASRRRRATE